MNFQDALTAVKEGKKIRRQCWGHAQWVEKNSDGELVWEFQHGAKFTTSSESLMAKDWEIVPEKRDFLGALKLLKHGLRVRHTSWQPKSHIRLNPVGRIFGVDPAGTFSFADFDINELLSENWVEYSAEALEDGYIDLTAFFRDGI